MIIRYFYYQTFERFIGEWEKKIKKQFIIQNYCSRKQVLFHLNQDRHRIIIYLSYKSYIIIVIAMEAMCSFMWRHEYSFHLCVTCCNFYNHFVCAEFFFKLKANLPFAIFHRLESLFEKKKEYFLKEIFFWHKRRSCAWHYFCV